MAINDIVAARISQSSPSAIQPQPTHFGRVVAEPESPLAENVTILWDTATRSIVSGATVAALYLDAIVDSDANTIATFTGKTVVRIAPDGPVTGDASGGTSREFVGTVIAVYNRTPYEDQDAGVAYLLVKSGDLYFEDLASRFTVLSDR